MAQKKKPHLSGRMGGDQTKKKRKEKGKTQKTPMQAVMVMGPTGKTHMEWRPW